MPVHANRCSWNTCLGLSSLASVTFNCKRRRECLLGTERLATTIAAYAAKVVPKAPGGTFSDFSTSEKQTNRGGSFRKRPMLPKWSPKRQAAPFPIFLHRKSRTNRGGSFRKRP